MKNPNWIEIIKAGIATIGAVFTTIIAYEFARWFILTRGCTQ